MCLPESARLKIERAQEHLDALKVAYRGHLALDPYKAIRQPSTEAGTHHFKFEVNPPPPPLGLYVGDFAHTLRSALDHIAVALTGDFDDPGVQFPIFAFDPEKMADTKRGGELRKKWNNQIGKAPLPAQNVIKQLQPYSGDDDPSGDPLWIIHELDIVDKHKAINVVFAGVPLVIFDPNIGAQVWRVEDGNEIMFQGADSDFNPTLLGKVGISWRKDTFIDLNVLSLIYEYFREKVAPPLAGLFPEPVDGRNSGPANIAAATSDPRSKMLIRFER